MKGANDHWLKYALVSGDPGVTFVAIFVCVFLVSIAIVAGAFLVVPFGIGFAVFKWAQWHARRPTPTSAILSATQQRVIAANFPDTEAFVDAFARRLIEMWRPSLPAESVADEMLGIAQTLYEAEGLNNPLPPVPSASPIEEGRYRDRLLAHARKCADAPATLAAFTDALSRSLSTLRDALPPLGRATPDEIRNSRQSQKTGLPVAPRAGARIETHDQGRPPPPPSSLPARERGSKHRSIRCAPLGRLSLPARERGSKLSAKP